MGEENSGQLSHWVFSKAEVLTVDLKGSDVIPYLSVMLYSRTYRVLRNVKILSVVKNY